MDGCGSVLEVKLDMIVRPHATGVSREEGPSQKARIMQGDFPKYQGPVFEDGTWALKKDVE